MKIWQTSDFDYELPETLIAQQPLLTRSSSRLLCVSRSNDVMAHRSFAELVNLVNPQDLLIFNDTKVIPARLLGMKESGGKIECLVERILSSHRVLVHLRASKS